MELSILENIRPNPGRLVIQKEVQALIAELKFIVFSFVFFLIIILCYVAGVVFEKVMRKIELHLQSGTTEVFLLMHIPN